MSVIHSQISPASDAFKANAEKMRRLVADFRDKAAIVERGGSDEARERHRSRGKLLPRDTAGAAARFRLAVPRDRAVRRLGSLWRRHRLGRPDRRHRPRRRPRSDDRRQRRHGEGRHLLSAHREEASARAGDRAAEQSALHLPRRFRRRQSAEPGRGVSRPRAFRPHLLQPGQHERGRHSADRLRHGLVHGGRRLCARDVRRDRSWSRTRRRSFWAARRW